MRFFVAGILISGSLLISSNGALGAEMPAQVVAPGVAALPVDSDHDGLSDALEDALLGQFAPRFMVSSTDCSGRPAAFVAFAANPAVESEDGTIYGQAFPRAGHADEVELHYYHLWKTDCGEMSHERDAEHVSVLVKRGDGLDSSEWKALYWYAAAHEDTVCDASQIARAAAIDGEAHGPRVWISRGKHASFLSEAICVRGCGGDDCGAEEPLIAAKIINLGELSAPMNGATWMSSPVWPLAIKMGRSDFTNLRIANVDGLADASVTWANPGKKPMLAIIADSNGVLGSVTTGLNATGSALNTADMHTDNALNSASEATTGSVEKAYRGVKKALGLSARHVGKALGGR